MTHLAFWRPTHCSLLAFDVLNKFNRHKSCQISPLALLLPWFNPRPKPSSALFYSRPLEVQHCRTWSRIIGEQCVCVWIALRIAPLAYCRLGLPTTVCSSSSAVRPLVCTLRHPPPSVDCKSSLHVSRRCSSVRRGSCRVGLWQHRPPTQPPRNSGNLRPHK